MGYYQDKITIRFGLTNMDMTYSQWHLFAKNEAIACLLQKKGLERLGSLLHYLALLGVIA